MRRHLALLLALSLPLVSLPDRALSVPVENKKSQSPPAPKPEKLDWLAFDAATAQAQKQGKHIIVDIYTTWCGWCKVMDRQTYGDPEVAAYLRSNFILAKVNGESASVIHWKGQAISERQFARAVGVTGYPATYFLKPNAELVGGVPGYIKAPDFMVYAQYISTKWYEKGKIQASVHSLQTAAQ